jgi:hypothetical protein
MLPVKRSYMRLPDRESTCTGTLFADIKSYLCEKECFEKERIEYNWGIAFTVPLDETNPCSYELCSAREHSYVFGVSALDEISAKNQPCI